MCFTLFYCFCQMAEFYGFTETKTMCTQAVYSFSLLRSLALGLVTLTASWAALCTVAVRWQEEGL